MSESGLNPVNGGNVCGSNGRRRPSPICRRYGMDRQDRGIETKRIARRIYKAVQSLRSMPYRGPYGRIENTRELAIVRLRYLVAYEISEERQVVLNVLHGAQRWP